MIGLPPISIIDTLPVHAEVRDHRFVREALALARVFRGKDERVIGTTNNVGAPVCQLYGWAPNVPEHIDNTGWIYFVPLLGKPSVISAGTSRVLAHTGDVCRMDDFVSHGTYDSSARVCLFIGPYEVPADDAALTALTAGLNLLASGTYSAPRVAPGFQHPGRDECYALVDDAGELMLIAEAKHRALVIATCSQCRRRAWKIDQHFPYCWSGNYCERHMPAAHQEAA